jgi:hypothetical protein
MASLGEKRTKRKVDDQKQYKREHARTNDSLAAVALTNAMGHLAIHPGASAG